MSVCLTVSFAAHDIQIECCWCLLNIVETGTQTQIQFLADRAAIPSLCRMLTSHNVHVVSLILKGLETMLRISARYAELLCADEESIELLKSLDAHDNSEIFTRSMAIFNEFVEERVA